MPQFQTRRIVHHTPANMFALVADIEAYPEFLPLCERLTIRSRRDDGSKTLLVADMTIGYKAIRESFTTQVLLKPDDLAIDVKYLDGPFRFLDNRWRFREADDNGCAVEFFIHYEFRNRVLGMVMGTMFDRAFRVFAQAFEERADSVYSRSMPSSSASTKS